VPSENASSVYWSPGGCRASRGQVLLRSHPYRINPSPEAASATLDFFCFCFFCLFFLKANALICAFQPEAFFPAPLLLELGPVPRAAVSELGKGLELSQGTGGRPRGASAPPPPAKPRWCPRERAAALAPVLLLLLQTRAGTPASTRCTAPARPLAPAPKARLRDRGGVPPAGHRPRAPARGTPAPWAAPYRAGRLPRGRGARGAGPGGAESQASLRSHPAERRRGARTGPPLRLAAPPLPCSARRGARGARTRGPASRPLPTPGARDKRRAAGAGARALQPASATGGPASPAAHPAPGAAELRRYLQPSERAGEPAPLPRNSPKLRGCRPPGAGGKVRARGAQTGRRTRGPSERTAVGGLSEPLRLPSAVSGRLDRRLAKYFRSIVYGMRLCVFVCVGGGS
jgi:hypothetical protein